MLCHPSWGHTDESRASGTAQHGFTTWQRYPGDARGAGQTLASSEGHMVVVPASQGEEHAQKPALHTPGIIG